MNRIELLASLTINSNTVCDIGCDHAYSLVYAIKKYNVKNGIAADIAIGPIENAKKTIIENKLEDKIKAIISDGFDNIDSDFDSVIISGMGGNLICDILKRGLNKIINKKLIIEANCDAYLVRKFLNKHNFKITNEIAIYDQNKYYEIMVFESGIEKLNDFDIKYGPILRKEKTAAFIKHYEKQLALLTLVLEKINDKSRREEKQALVDEISLMLKY